MERKFINSWYLCFDKEHRQYEKVLESFGKFYNDRSMVQLTPPSHCVIGGQLEGGEVYTPPIVSIERVAYGYPFGNDLGDTFLATTTSGSKYYLGGNDYDPMMIMVVGRLHHEKIERIGRYHKPKRYHIPVAM